MKKTLLAFMLSALAAGAFGQGTVVFENAAGNGYITYSSPNGPNVLPGQYTVALLWFNGASFQQIATFEPTSGNLAENGPGYFYDPTTVNVPTFSATGTFEVQGWNGNFANYAAAIVGGAATGQTHSFATKEGQAGPPPNGTPPAPLSGAGGSWDGNLVLIPEPSTIALGGFGAAALWLFRRRKK
jgi:hypothetical protein